MQLQFVQICSFSLIAKRFDPIARNRNVNGDETFSEAQLATQSKRNRCPFRSVLLLCGGFCEAHVNLTVFARLSAVANLELFGFAAHFVARFKVRPARVAAVELLTFRIPYRQQLLHFRFRFSLTSAAPVTAARNVRVLSWLRRAYLQCTFAYAMTTAPPFNTDSMGDGEGEGNTVYAEKAFGHRPMFIFIEQIFKYVGSFRFVLNVDKTKLDSSFFCARILQRMKTRKKRRVNKTIYQL